MTPNGETIKTWTHSTMTEPMCVAVDRNYDHILVGDSACNIHAFKASTGQHLFTVNRYLISTVWLLLKKLDSPKFSRP